MTNEEKARDIEFDVYTFGEKPKGQFEAPAYRGGYKNGKMERPAVQGVSGEEENIICKR